MTSTTAERVDVLVVAAHGPHLRGLGSALGDRFHGTIGSLSVSAKTVGIGPAAAAASTAKRVFALRPRVVIQLGVASAYSLDDGFHPNNLVVPDKIVFADHGVVAGVSRFPQPMVIEAAVTMPVATGLMQSGTSESHSVRQVRVASPASATESVHTAAEVRHRTGALVENLEAFGIRYACGLAEVPYAAVLSVTDIIGPDRDHHRTQFEREATFASARLVLDWLGEGAHGLSHHMPED